MPKRILVVARDRSLRESRSALMEAQGYAVICVETDEQALELLKREVFDLVLLGQNSFLTEKGFDQQLREKYPNLLTLKIEAIREELSVYSSRSTLPVPIQVIRTVAEMLSGRNSKILAAND